MTLFPVSRDGKYGYIDASGQLVVPIEFASGMSFNEGMAGVKIDAKGKWGFMNDSGDIGNRSQVGIAQNRGFGHYLWSHGCVTSNTA